MTMTKISPRLYIGNLKEHVDAAALLMTFKPFGSIVSTSLKVGFAFIEYASMKEAKAASDAMDGKVFDGRSLIVEIAKGDIAKNVTRGKYPLFVKGMNSETTWRDLKDFIRSAFSKRLKDSNDILGFAQVWTTNDKTFGLVEFVNSDDRSRAIKKLKGKSLHGSVVQFTTTKPDQIDDSSCSRSRSRSPRTNRHSKHHSQSRSRSRSRSHRAKRRSKSSRDDPVGAFALTKRSKSRSRSPRTRHHSKSRSPKRDQKAVAADQTTALPANADFSSKHLAVAPTKLSAPMAMPTSTPGIVQYDGMHYILPGYALPHGYDPQPTATLAKQSGLSLCASSVSVEHLANALTK